MGKYDDIINLPHHVSKNHPQMSNYDRAAQFAPFAALVGFSEAIKSSEEQLERRIVLSEERKDEIEKQLQNLTIDTKVKITYFVVKDKKKDLGKYVFYKGFVKKIDVSAGKLIFENKKSICLKDIYNIEDE